MRNSSLGIDFFQMNLFFKSIPSVSGTNGQGTGITIPSQSESIQHYYKCRRQKGTSCTDGRRGATNLANVKVHQLRHKLHNGTPQRRRFITRSKPRLVHAKPTRRGTTIRESHFSKFLPPAQGELIRCKTEIKGIATHNFEESAQF